MQKIKYPNRHRFQTEDEYKEACHAAFEKSFREFKRESKETISEVRKRMYFESKKEKERRAKKKATRKEQALRRKTLRELEQSIY